MKIWIVPVTVGAFVAGSLGGVATRPSIPSTKLEESAPKVEAEKTASPLSTTGAPAPVSAGAASPIPSGPFPWPEAQSEVPAKPRLTMLRFLAERMPRRQLTRSLWEAVWQSEALEIKAFDCSRRIQDPETLDALLFVLDNIQNEELRHEILGEMHTARDPVRRRFLAGILGAAYQEPEFLHAAMDLLRDDDPEVVEAALEGINVGRFKGPERQEASRRLKEAAGPSRPAAVRAKALAALAKSNDFADLGFLMGELALERDAACRTAAIEALSEFEFSETEAGPETAQAIRMLWRSAIDPMETDEARSSATLGVERAYQARASRAVVGKDEWDIMMSQLRISR
jgi:hypothetical protein